MRKIITLLSGIVAIVIAIAVAIWARNNYGSLGFCVERPYMGVV